MGLPISYSSGAGAFWRTFFLLLSALLFALVSHPGMTMVHDWLPALVPGDAQTDIARCILAVGAAALLLLGVFGRANTWTIGLDGLTHVRSGWWGQTAQHYDFSSIASVTAQEYVTDGSAGGWKLHIRLKSGRRLSIRFGDSWEEVWQAKCEIEDALGVGSQ